MAYGQCEATAPAKHEGPQVRLRVDGGEPESLGITTIAAANGRYFGSGMCVAPQVSTKDGRFDPTLWRDYSLADFVLKSKGVYNGDHVTWTKTLYTQCKSLRAHASKRRRVRARALS